MKIVGESGECETGIAYCGRKWREAIFFSGINQSIGMQRCEGAEMICAHSIPVSIPLKAQSSIAYNNQWLFTKDKKHIRLIPRVD